MGKGIDMARGIAPEHAGLLDDLKDQLLIVFLKRLGGRVEISIAEVDDTGQDLFAFALDLDRRFFTFELRRKS